MRLLCDSVHTAWQVYGVFQGARESVVANLKPTVRFQDPDVIQEV